MLHPLQKIGHRAPFQRRRRVFVGKNFRAPTRSVKSINELPHAHEVGQKGDGNPIRPRGLTSAKQWLSLILFLASFIPSARSADTDSFESMFYQQLIAELGGLGNNLAQRLVEIAPRLAAALALLVLGIVLAYIVRSLSRRLIAGLVRLVPGQPLRRIVRQADLQRSAGKAVGQVFFWAILIFFFTAATETLGLPVVSVWLSKILLYLPQFLAALLILFAGFVGGRVLRDLIPSAAASAGIKHGAALGRLAQMAVLTVSALIAVDQAGLNVGFLTSVLLLVLGSGLLGGALVFALGARATVANILASYYVQKTYRVGHRVRIGDFEGEIVRITATAVVLQAAEGQVSVPASRFGEQASILLLERK